MYALTCGTEGCVNHGITILLVGIGEIVVCGPCGQQITDIQTAILGDDTPPSPEPEEEPGPDPESPAE